MALEIIGLPVTYLRYHATLNAYTEMHTVRNVIWTAIWSQLGCELEKRNWGI